MKNLDGTITHAAQRLYDILVNALLLVEGEEAEAAAALREFNSLVIHPFCWDLAFMRKARLQPMDIEHILLDQYGIQVK